MNCLTYFVYMIQMSNLTKQFGEKTAVDIPSLSIGQGEIIGLVGNNGAGKTTLFRLMLDLTDPTTGDIDYCFKPSLRSDSCEIIHSDSSIEGTNSECSIFSSTSEGWKPYVGAYLDENFLIDFLTPEEYFEFMADVHHISRKNLYDKLDRYKDLMNEEILGQKKYIRNFSAGNKQKIGIIATFLPKNQLLILDEPFNYLDPKGQNILKHCLVELNQKLNLTILVSSHNLQHTIDISTRVLLMEKGHIVKDLTSIDAQARHELESYFSVDYTSEEANSTSY